MPDRPIIFSGPIVRALLDGRKTMTRRVLSGKAAMDLLCMHRVENTPRGPIAREYDRSWPIRVPYAVGDRLWVREAWTLGATDERPDGFAVYRADGRPAHPIGRWRSSIHMPRWASRLTLTVTEVKVERLQDISEDDAREEGIEHPATRSDCDHPRHTCAEIGCMGPGYRGPFAAIWNAIHGPGAWDANPWVAAVRFTVERGNIDALAPRPADTPAA